MTLAEWNKDSPVVARPFRPTFNGAALNGWSVPYGGLPDRLYRALWDLDDVRVTSVTGGSVWLMPRVPRTS